MTANRGPAAISSGSNSGRVLDTARGILIALRRCPAETAFDELHNAAQRHRLPVFEIAWALVHLAVEEARHAGASSMPSRRLGGSGVSFLRMRRRNASLAVVWGSTAAS